MGFKLMAGAVASCALIGVAVGVGIIYGSLLFTVHVVVSFRNYMVGCHQWICIKVVIAMT